MTGEQSMYVVPTPQGGKSNISSILNSARYFSHYLSVYTGSEIRSVLYSMGAEILVRVRSA